MSAPIDVHEFPPNGDLVIRFTKPMPVEEVIEWSERLSRGLPGRRVILVEHGTEVRIESKQARRTNLLLAAAVAILLLDLAVRAFA